MRDVLNIAAPATQGLRTASKLNIEQIYALMDVAVNGFDNQGRGLRFNEVSGAPVCHHCDREYPMARAIASGIDLRHLCCSCAATACEALRICGPRSTAPGHMARTPSGRDDTRSGSNTKY